VFSEDKRLDNLSILLSYVHHISTRHLRPSSVVRKYIRYHAAYVSTQEYVAHNYMKHKVLKYESRKKAPRLRTMPKE
jgi:hypothetical protein